MGIFSKKENNFFGPGGVFGTGAFLPAFEFLWGRPPGGRKKNSRKRRGR